MRCDNCPLCPIAEDDVCLETEGKYGIEHADGMLGCKHPRNWAEKRSDEHDTALGIMGTDMGIEMSYSNKDFEILLDECKHMVGLDNQKPYRRIYHRHGKAFYKPYRNYYSAPESGNRLLDKLPFYIISKKKGERYIWYKLTREGLDWLGRQLNITIKNEED